MTVVPAKLLLHGLVLSALFHQGRNFSDRLEALGFVKQVANIGVLGETRVQEFEHVGAQSLQVRLTRVLLIQIDILRHQLVHVIDFAWVVKRRVLEDGLRAHHSVAASQLKCALHVLEGPNAAIANDWNFQGLFNFSDHVVIGGTNAMLVVLLAPAVHRQ
eukprot:CAMPEP_0185574544 /NCGR_PEP_ID=MMETSP0434-20130131/5991_1 /TAXON_ID=626734 ORGANISM="Favella taraikaensis, Strain Fe Narragansett Bay" /NCGR_SAMPLE_ID=MMETSP0434 /ASSEMBLY_ACC=CAM_ASM_000379 /LENGTH=159 /DNA_ID=CAMNT_0028191165 /DNA_START=292 /DNA_END=771 /DNA_ORIENTATION=-